MVLDTHKGLNILEQEYSREKGRSDIPQKHTKSARQKQLRAATCGSSRNMKEEGNRRMDDGWIDGWMDGYVNGQVEGLKDEGGV